MAKICPGTPIIIDASPYTSSEREIFTIWMKSLVFNGNGFTAFSSKGEMVFRVDNYQEKRCSEVYLMDPNGYILFSIRKQKLPILGQQWNIYKWSDSNFCREGPWFRLKRSLKLAGLGSTTCNVSHGWDKSKRCCYSIIEMKKNSTYKIIDSEDQLVAEVRRKQSSSGVCLGNDVFSLIVEPQKDYSLIMALVTVHGLINGKV
ncbi:hypothetical protein LIER_26158 [Lithospermum erythrorhizon]|uniref:Uncharacterized protein n=1 Tax=Lithospermum erythrorhizon TaxID=34254 RepID=A0AAV3RBD3_LITER